jgi:TP901 family phage tail tape measure protein
MTQSFLGTIGKVGAGVAAIGAPVGLIAGMAKVVSVGAEFERQMSNVRAFVSGTDSQFQQLSDTAERLVATTAFTASDAASAMAEMGRAGLSANQILGASEGVLTLAAAGDIEMAEAATIAAAALNQFGIPAAEMGSVVDRLAKAASSGSISLSGMGTQLSYAASSATSFGMDLGETAGIIATLATTLGEDKAGTSFRAMLTSLQAPSAGAAQTLASLGVSLTDAAGNFLELPAIVDQFNVALSGMSDGDKAAKLNAIFNTRGLPAFATLMSQGADSMRDMTRAVNDSDGFGLSVANEKLDNVAGSFEMLKSAASGMAIDVFQTFQGPLKEALQATANYVSGPMTSGFVTLMEWMRAFGLVATFAWENFALIAGTSIDKTALVFAGLWKDLAHFLGVNMGEILDWLFSNWSSVWRDMLKLTMSIIGNIVQNVRNMGSAVWETIKSLGEKPLTFDMVPLMDGVQSTTAALELTPRLASEFEQQMSAQIASDSASLQSNFDDFLAHATEGIGSLAEESIATSEMATATPIEDASKVVGTNGESGGEDIKRDSLSVSMKGSREAFDVINKAIRGGADSSMKSLAKQAEKQTVLAEKQVGLLEDIAGAAEDDEVFSI